ncbi:MAG: GtrA family protein [Patescibacteria group bacterium]
MIAYISSWFKEYQILRYLVSGFLAAVAFFGTLILLKELLGVWYLYASTAAYLVSLVVSFTLQKFWTFGNTDTRMGAFTLQAVLYGANAFLGLFLNGFILYIAVERLHLWYVTGQVIASVVFALLSFFVFSRIFKKASGSA